MYRYVELALARIFPDPFLITHLVSSNFSGADSLSMERLSLLFKLDFSYGKYFR